MGTYPEKLFEKLTEHHKHRKHHRQNCKPGEVYENGVCMQKIGYGHRHHRHHRHYLPPLDYRSPVVYTYPVYNRPIYTTPKVIKVTEPTSSTSHSSNFNLYLLLVFFIVMFVSIFLVVFKRG